jgi:hypothetical protein
MKRTTTLFGSADGVTPAALFCLDDLKAHRPIDARLSMLTEYKRLLCLPRQGSVHLFKKEGVIAVVKSALRRYSSIENIKLVVAYNSIQTQAVDAETVFLLQMRKSRIAQVNATFAAMNLSHDMCVFDELADNVRILHYRFELILPQTHILLFGKTLAFFVDKNNCTLDDILSAWGDRKLWPVYARILNFMVRIPMVASSKYISSGMRFLPFMLPWFVDHSAAWTVGLRLNVERCLLRIEFLEMTYRISRTKDFEIEDYSAIAVLWPTKNAIPAVRPISVAFYGDDWTRDVMKIHLETNLRYILANENAFVEWLERTCIPNGTTIDHFSVHHGTSMASFTHPSYIMQHPLASEYVATKITLK